MAAFAQDSFTDTAGTDLASHTPDVGGGWTRRTLSHYSGGHFVISNANRCRRASGELSNALYENNGTPPDADYIVEGTVRQVTDIDSEIALAGRINTAGDTADTLYYANYSTYASSGHFNLFKTVNGTYTQLGSNYTDAIGNGNERTFQLSLVGTTISVIVAGTTRISVTDSAISSAGKAGLRSYYQASDTTGLHIDNFSAVPAAGGGGATASGTLDADVSTVDGAASGSSTASGTPDAQASTVAGAASGSSSASGAAGADESTVSGSATVSDPDAGASGTLDADAAAAAGVATSSSTASGTPDASASTADGTAITSWVATGAPAAQTSTLDGTAAGSSAGDGDLFPAECVVVGIAVSSSTGSGVLICLASSVSGSEAPIVAVARALMGGLLVRVGRLMGGR